MTARLRDVSLWGAAGLALAFIVVPVLAVMLRVGETRAWEAAQSDAVPRAVALSFSTTLATLTLTVVFGTPLAFVLARRQFAFKRLINSLVELPIVLPPAVAGLALLIAFGRRGVIGAALDDAGITVAFTTAAVVLAQTFVAAPLYVRAAQLGFMSIPKEVEDAARVDGADGFALFRLVTLPLSRRALAAGLVLCWARALGEFGATILFAGSLEGRTQTMPLLIYNIIERDIDAALWTGLILITFAMVALVASQWLAPRERDDALSYGML
jgi:molybdate transport system permease protein